MKVQMPKSVEIKMPDSEIGDAYDRAILRVSREPDSEEAKLELREAQKAMLRRMGIKAR